jgi:hypothetical protein
MAENLKSIPVTNLDAQPGITATSGEGAPGYMKVADDNVSPSASNTQWSTYRLCRFPTNAKVKHVWMYTSGIDSNATATAKFDLNVAFSDSLYDYTQVSYQGTIPSSNHDGTSLAFVAGTGYSTAYQNSGTGNKLFGSAVAVANSGAVQLVETTWKGSPQFTPVNRDDDVWDVLGFVNAQGLAMDPGGFFDILAVLSTGAATAATGVLAVEVDYVL